MYILGISAFYHDSAACLIRNGEIIAAAQEERFSRIKHDPSFPSSAIDYCMKQAKIDSSKISKIIFYEKPFLKFERIIETYLAFVPMGFSSFRRSMPIWIKDKLFQKKNLINELSNLFGGCKDWESSLLFSEHHLSHAGSAFFPSPFENAAILTIDGVGEWTTTSLAIGRGNNIKLIKEIHFPHSIGLLYSAFTYYLGFKVNSGEYKVMGLAPYGKPIYADLIKEKLINIASDGSFKLNMSYFNYPVGNMMIKKKFETLFNSPVRRSESNLSQFHMDVAASIQCVTEEVVVCLAQNIANETGQKNLCLAGGVSLNCVINGVLQRKKIFKNIWVQPAAGDAGGALGAALCAWYMHLGNDRINNTKDKMKGSFLGPSYSNDEIKSCLKKCGANYIEFDEERLIQKTVEALIQSKAVGWMQGRMEYGPRALGARSIIADPRSPNMQKQLNLKVKFRESFRPFAPSIIESELENWFDTDTYSPYMLFVANLRNEHRKENKSEKGDFRKLESLNENRSSIPAVTHIDYSARVQTVHQETNPLYYKLLSEFFNKTGCPILVNTSFNVRGEPIVCSPEEAFRCFMGTDLDVLVIGSNILYKQHQDQSLKENYEDNFELD